MAAPFDDASSTRHEALLHEVLRTLAERLDTSDLGEQLPAAIDELVLAAKAELQRLSDDRASPARPPSSLPLLGPGVLAELIKRSRAPRESTTEPLVDARR